MASAAEITSDQHATTTGQHGKPKRADKTYGELENSVHAQISMPKAHKQASTPAVGAFAVGRPARTMRNVTPFERLPRRISSGDYSGKTYEPLERVNGKESVARVTAHTLSNPQLPQQSSPQAPASPSSTVISAKSQGLSLTPPQRILCCDRATLKIHQHFPEDYDTAVRLLMENRKGRFPHRTVNALDFKIPWTNFDYIIGITTINQQILRKNLLESYASNCRPMLIEQSAWKF
ncbi:hypothetical protein B0O99DRAFT_607685 [Bisporella sp. PMI_857]|nr:hypothetical protein B0O99DRAFT_607685 [Bisporella sp. PMI_857]